MLNRDTTKKLQEGSNIVVIVVVVEVEGFAEGDLQGDLQFFIRHHRLLSFLLHGVSLVPTPHRS